MALSINTNISSLIAQNSFRLATEALSQNQLRLSTGLRINSAADDPAGLSISTRMTAQIRGLNQAIRNTYDGISMMQTAEGNLEEMQDILQRMRELAVQASNALTDSDRNNINQEYQEKLAELDRIVDTAQFNELKLLDGTTGIITFQVGPNTSAANKIQVNLSTNLHSSHIGATNEYGDKIGLKNDINSQGSVAISDGSIAVNGLRLNVTPYVTYAQNFNMSQGGYKVIEKGHSQSSAYAIAQAINQLTTTRVVAHAKNIYTAPNEYISNKVTNKYHATATGTYTVAVKAYGYYTLRINNFTVFSNYKITATKITQVHLNAGEDATVSATVKIGASTIAAAINKMSHTLGVTAQMTNGGKIRLNNLDGGNIKITERAGTQAKATITNSAGGYKGKTYANVFEGQVNGMFINRTIHRGLNPLASGTTGGAFTIRKYRLTTTGGTGVANFAVIRGTVTITGPSAFKFSDLWESGEATNGDPALNFTPVTTSAGGVINIGKTDFTRVKDKVISSQITTQNNQVADGYYYKFSVAKLQMFLKTTNVLTVENAQKAINRIDQAINDLTKFRTMIGAMHNRFQSTIDNLNSYVQNLIDANSRIMDADIAKEAAELTMNDIKRQAAAAMLSQANQNPSIALQLLSIGG